MQVSSGSLMELYLGFTWGNWLQVQWRLLEAVPSFGSRMNEDQPASLAMIPNYHSQHCFFVTSKAQLRLKLYRDHVNEAAVTTGGGECVSHACFVLPKHQWLSF